MLLPAGHLVLWFSGGGGRTKKHRHSALSTPTASCLPACPSVCLAFPAGSSLGLGACTRIHCCRLPFFPRLPFPSFPPMGQRETGRGWRGRNVCGTCFMTVTLPRRAETRGAGTRVSVRSLAPRLPSVETHLRVECAEVSPSACRESRTVRPVEALQQNGRADGQETGSGSTAKRESVKLFE